MRNRQRCEVKKQQFSIQEFIMLLIQLYLSYYKVSVFVTSVNLISGQTLLLYVTRGMAHYA